MSNTQANHTRALVSDAGTQVNPRTGNSETQTMRPNSTETQTMTNPTITQGTGTEQASSPMETQTTPRNAPQVFNMAINDRQDERIERTNQIIQDTISKKIKKKIKKRQKY